MLVKILTHKRPSYTRLLEYMMNNKERLFDKSGKSFLITQNLKGRTIDGWVKQYQENETYRRIHRKDNIKIFHEVLSWHREDAKHLTLDKIENMTREYLRLRNIKGVSLAVPHHDKSHIHVHICTSGVGYKTGLSMSLSKTNLSVLKRTVQDYEVKIYPELTKSVLNHGKGNKTLNSEKEYNLKMRTGREADKTILTRILNSAYKNATTKEVFFSSLSREGAETYSRSGKITGVIFNKRKYRFSRLGFTEEQFKVLEGIENREMEIKKVREKKRNMNRARTL